MEGLPERVLAFENLWRTNCTNWRVLFSSLNAEKRRTRRRRRMSERYDIITFLPNERGKKR